RENERASGDHIRILGVGPHRPHNRERRQGEQKTPSVYAFTLHSSPFTLHSSRLHINFTKIPDISEEQSMIKPYTAVGLIPTVRGIRKRKDILVNLEHLSHLVKAAAWLSSLDLPVRLIAFPEGALQGFNDEVLDLDHVKFAREGAIDIPGEETEYLGKIAREYDAFIMAQAKARHPDLKDRFFNVGFILNPKGKVILQHYKVSP